MHTNDESTIELVELGSVTTDTEGTLGLVPEGFDAMRSTGITAE